MKIRRAVLADLPALVSMETLFPSDRMSAASLRRFLRVPSACVWVAVEREKILGSLVLLAPQRQGTARIYSVIVAPMARGRGLGRRLVQTAERHVRATHEGLRLEVRADNRAARALYRSLHYVEQRRLPAYYDDGADGIRLQRRFKTA